MASHRDSLNHRLHPDGPGSPRHNRCRWCDARFGTAGFSLPCSGPTATEAADEAAHEAALAAGAAQSNERHATLFPAVTADGSCGDGWRETSLGSGVLVRKHHGGPRDIDGRPERPTGRIYMTGPGDGGRWFLIESKGRTGVVLEAALRLARGEQHGALVARIAELERQLAERALASSAIEDTTEEDSNG